MTASTASLFVGGALWLLSGFGSPGQKPQEPIPVVFHRLESESPTVVAEAAHQLLLRGNAEPKVKEYLTQNLPPLIEKGPANRQYPGTWTALVRLAADLKIGECAPALAKWLKIDNVGEITTAGFTRLETNPAGRALVEIGDPAIPALVGVLNRGEPRERRYAAYALNLISSPRAKDVLRQHLRQEPDDSLREFIRKALDH